MPSSRLRRPHLSELSINSMAVVRQRFQAEVIFGKAAWNSCSPSLKNVGKASFYARTSGWVYLFFHPSEIFPDRVSNKVPWDWALVHTHSHGLHHHFSLVTGPTRQHVYFVDIGGHLVDLLHHGRCDLQRSRCFSAKFVLSFWKSQTLIHGRNTKVVKGKIPIITAILNSFWDAHHWSFKRFEAFTEVTYDIHIGCTGAIKEPSTSSLIHPTILDIIHP